MKTPESIIVCEGYHDRAFLRGWLVHGLSCESLERQPYGPHDNRPLTGQGQYGFRSKSGRWLRIVPAKGDTLVSDIANTFVGQLLGNPDANVVLAWDADDKDREAQFHSWAKSAGAIETPPFYELRDDGGLIRLALLVFRADEDADDLPVEQTLERLACAAVRDAYPERSRAVFDWLRTRPMPPLGEKRHKSHAASHMAGWYSDAGYEGFFDRIWEDTDVRAALERRLRATGAARIVESMV